MYCKTDWSSGGMGVDICQADTNPEALRAKAAENKGGKFIFDLTKLNIDLCLRPLSFASRANTKAEKNYHSYVGEASVRVFASKTLCHLRFGRQFTLIADYSGLCLFFEQESLPTHVL
jgi:hypothetical protein